MKTAAEAAEAVRRVQLHDASVAQQRQPQEATNRIDLMLAPHEWEEGEKTAFLPFIEKTKKSPVTL